MTEKRSREQKREKVIEVLNKARGMELQAIAQYMNHHYNLDDMDYGDMAAKVKLIAVDEMRHAEDFAERIKELDGEPVTEPIAETRSSDDVEVILKSDLKLEDDTLDDYNDFLEVCRENGDSTSAKIFERIIDEEQMHFNYFDDVRDHIERLGQPYLARIAGTPSTTNLNSPGFAAREGADAADQGA